MARFQMIVNILVLIAMAICIICGYVNYYSSPTDIINSAPASANLALGIPFLLFGAIFNAAIFIIRHRTQINAWKQNAPKDSNFPNAQTFEQQTIL